ncbi:hypothetical protein BSK33_12170 [Geobacillus sp. 44B]|nr:hypothetical protein BSK33_12170 [Geobacillus sp. 44B]
MERAYQESPYSRFSISLFFIPFRRIIVFFRQLPALAILAKEAATGAFRSPNINDGTRYMGGKNR